MVLPVFKRKDIQITNFKTGASHFMRRADEIQDKQRNISRIVSICNEPLVYGFLFRKRLDGKP